MEVRATSLYGDRDGDRGAGGKLGKPHVRKRQATPYDRPPVNLAIRCPGSWWSKLSDPAYRLVSGATKLILPSFLTNSPTILPSTEPEPQPESELEGLPLPFIFICCFCRVVLTKIFFFPFLFLATRNINL